MNNFIIANFIKVTGTDNQEMFLNVGKIIWYFKD